MNSNDRNKLINNLISIENKKTKKKIQYTNINVELIVSKYSNTKIPIYKLKIDNTIINRNNNYRVKYKCLNCDKEQCVNLNNIVRKINKNITDCNYCKNLNIDKRTKQSNFMKNKDSNYQKKIKKVYSNIELIEISKQEFLENEDEYIHSYFRKHMDYDEFERIRSKIISIQNDKFTDLSQFNYVPYLKISNQTKYNPYLYDSINDKFENIRYIKYKCDCCSNTFTNRDLFIQKNKFKILCKDCNFTNNIYKIRSTKNMNNDKIRYQSKLELKFIQHCNKNKILVLDGPKINYIHNNKIKRYIVDFYLPQINTLVEIKANHYWHICNKKNGIWDAKLDAVKKIVKDKQYDNFMVIYSNKLIEKINLIKQQIY